MNQETNKTSPIMGYFVAVGDERTTLKKEKMVNVGRTGIFYEKEKLISTLESNKMLKKTKMDIVEIKVDPCCIISPNCIKFGIKGGKQIPITKVQPLTLALRELKLMTVLN